MATEIKVPALGESITSGILASWHVKDGDFVEKDQTIFDLETDKITSEGTAEVAGKISLKVEEGDEVEVGAVVAEIDESTSGDSSQSSKDNSEDGDDEKEENPPSSSPPSKHKDSPAVRRISEEAGIDSSEIEGTGKAGRVTKGDMLKALESKASDHTALKDSVPTQPTKSEPSSERTTRKKMTPLRRTIAQRLVEAQQTTAMLTTFNEVDMTAVMNLRKKYQEAFVKKNDIKLGFMSFFTKAVVHALKEVSAVNAQIDGQEIVQNHYYDIGIAVSTPKGLMVPVIKSCETKGFAEIEKDIISYANKAKEGKIGIDDLSGGVFTITNGGIFGSMLSTPILNAPQSAILGMHTIQQRPVAIDGEVVIRPMMYLALSYDHRIVDGKEAVTFLVKVKEAIEDPSRLLFGV